MILERCRASALLAVACVCVSVRVSVTRRYCIETTASIPTKFAQRSASSTRVLGGGVAI